MKEVSLYIHIPFCISKCIYCDFYSETDTFTKDLIPEEYIDMLLLELAKRKEYYKIDKWKTVYVGGGTPSLLTENQIKRIFKKINENTDSTTEITFECNPGDITKEKLDALQKSGVNRLSLGIQSMNDEVLQSCKRRSTKEINLTSINLVKQSNAFTLSIDLISGLPKETMDTFISGLKEIIDLNPHHISLYSLVIENSTSLGKQIKQKQIYCDENVITDQWLAGKDILTSNNYIQYEVSNFCKKGYECIHNKTYWLLNDYIGIGAGATGTINEYRYTNPSSVKQYLQCIPEEKEIRDKETIIFEYLMMGFRMLQGISPIEFSKRFNENLLDRIEPVFTQWKKANKALVLANGNYALTSEGLLFLNQFLESI